MALSLEDIAHLLGKTVRLPLTGDSDDIGAGWRELPEMRKLRDEAIARFGLIDARIVHRLGVVRGGDNIVFIAAGAEHRAPALDACRWLIDTLKARVPIWKKEITPEGETWVTPHP